MERLFWVRDKLMGFHALLIRLTNPEFIVSFGLANIFTALLANFLTCKGGNATVCVISINSFGMYKNVRLSETLANGDELFSYFKAPIHEIGANIQCANKIVLKIIPAGSFHFQSHYHYCRELNIGSFL